MNKRKKERKKEKKKEDEQNRNFQHSFLNLLKVSRTFRVDLVLE